MGDSDQFQATVFGMCRLYRVVQMLQWLEALLSLIFSITFTNEASVSQAGLAWVRGSSCGSDR